MKTSELISSLVEDHAALKPVRRAHSLLRIAVGVMVSLAVFFAFLGVRPDFSQAVTDPRILFKFAISSALVVTLFPLAVMSLRPEFRPSEFLYWLIVPALVLLIGIVIQIASCETGTCIQGMIGNYPMACLRNIPALALGPFIALLTILRYGAPSEPTCGAAIAGAASGGIGAFIYAFHCPDDSSLFVALWYMSAVGLMTLAGAVIGSRILKW